MLYVRIVNDVEDLFEELPISMACAQQTTAECVAGAAECKFLISAKDSKGQPLRTGGATFVVECQAMHCSVCDNKDGTYSVSCTPEDTKTTSSQLQAPVSISLHGKPIRGSPFVVRFQELMWDSRTNLTLSNGDKTAKFISSTSCDYYHVYVAGPPLQAGRHRWLVDCNLQCFGSIGVTSDRNLQDGTINCATASSYVLATHSNCVKSGGVVGQHYLQPNPSLYSREVLMDMTIDIDVGEITFLVDAKTYSLRFPARTAMYMFATFCNVGTATLRSFEFAKTP
jgi:hypothetical protein